MIDKIVQRYKKKTMKSLKEVSYKDILSPKAMQSLSKQSADSLRQMISGDVRGAMMKSMSILQEVMEIEKPYRKELEQLAVDIVKELYGIIGDNAIEIEAQLTNNIRIEITQGETPVKDVDNIDDLLNSLSIGSNIVGGEAKRRLINSITQGAAIRGSFAFHLFKNKLDEISPQLVEKYGELLNSAYGIYDDDNTIAMMLAMLANNQQTNGGESEAVYNKAEDKFIIKAKALIFPILLQEIIKGLYEIVSLQGFSSDAERNKNIVKTTDLSTNEPEDIRYGKFIFDALNKLYVEYGSTDNREKEYFLSELYRLPEDEFIPYIDNLIQNALTPQQKRWTKDTFDEIQVDLRKDDTGLEDL